MNAEIVVAHGILDEMTFEPDPSQVAILTTLPSQQMIIIYNCTSNTLEIFVGLYISQGYVWNPSEVKQFEVPDVAVQQALDLTPEWRESFKEMWIGFLKKNGFLKEK